MSTTQGSTSLVGVTAPKFEHHHSGLGVNTPTPRISWKFNHLSIPTSGWQQNAYEIEITNPRSLTTNVYHVESNDSVYVPWPASPLVARQQATVRVRCRGAQNNEQPRWTGWSPASTVETSLISPDGWEAQVIAVPQQEKNEDESLKPIRLTKPFDTQSKPVTSARLYITAYGCYEAKLNGQLVGDHFMAPGWQSYKHRLHYQIFDVSELLSNHNEIDVLVTPGWYASKLAWAKGRRCFYGNELALLAQVMIDYADGTTETVKTDGTWKSCASPIISSEIQNGEVYQQSTDLPPKAMTSSAVKTLPFPKSQLVSPDTAPARVTQTVAPQKIFTSPSGKTLVDFGQNLVGRLRVKTLQKPAGTRVSFAHAEVLEHGELGRRPLRGAKSTDTIICDGNILTSWSPKTTFHGFRFVEITGWSTADEQCPLLADSIVAEVIHTDMERIGRFECSNVLVNKLHENATWSMRGNFLSVPTDCPQRDERLGWTGDIQVFAPSASFLYNTTGMLGNWLDDLAVEQAERNGVPPFVVPDVITKFDENDSDFWPQVPNAVWDDVAVLLPWSLYTASGDLYMLEKQYTSMKSWLDQGVQRGEDGLWDDDLYQLGDWLDPIAPPSEPGNGRTDGVVVANSYLIQVTRKVADAARILKHFDDAERYSADYKRFLEIYRTKYITKTGLVIADTQTALALAIVFDLLETPQQIVTAGKRLARAVRLQQFRVATGFAGTPIILKALTQTGYPQLAYRMLLEQRCPSWMYAIAMGATTIWERWDSQLMDGAINPGEMTSFNHYALGSVVNWLHEIMGGLSPLEPGYKVFQIKPVPGGNITSCKVSHQSPYGLIECDWVLKDDKFDMTVLVPPNTNAIVYLPGEENTQRVGSGQQKFTSKFRAQIWPPEAVMPPFWPQPTPLLAE